MEQKIVVHLKNGTVHKGITQDFEPDCNLFHCLPAEGGGVPVRVRMEEMKALFWVKDYLGNRRFVARRRFDDAKLKGRRGIVTFQDGEEIWGTLAEDEPEGGAGFFFYPVDPDDNNVRIFVIRSAMKELRLVS
jgi:hypothetical protein